MKSLSLVSIVAILFSLQAKAGSCAATISCKSGTTASCALSDRTAFDGNDTTYDVRAVCGVIDANARFCRTDFIDRATNVSHGTSEIVCCNPNGEAISTRKISDCR